MKNNFIKSENFTKWAIRKVSVGVVSAAIASGIFIVVGSGEAHASDLQDKAPVVQNVENKQVDDSTESKVIKNKVNTVGKETKQVEKSTVEAKNVVSAEKQPEVKSEKEVSIESKETDVNNLIKQAKDVAEPQTTPVEVKKAVMENTKDIVDVQAKYLDKANFPGPFTAGVNQVIPYEFFGGDGMLTRLILKSSDKAPWSDNGSEKNPALLPLEKLGKGLYFYEVDLEGTKGKSDKELLDLLKANGTQSYKATIKVYGEKDGKADLTSVVATKDIDVNLNGLTSVNEVKKAVMENTKDIVDVQAKYLDKANFPGPFTAGVNQVIPYEFFGGDGMLTRLILKSSDKAPWSDNGSEKNPALPPVEKLGHGLYFYEVDLAGIQGKQDKELLDLLKANGTQSYKATIKVYGEKDGKADLTSVVATKEVTINLYKETKQMDMKPGEDMIQNNTATDSMNSNVSGKVVNMSKSDSMSMKSSMNKDMMPENMTMDSHMNKDMMQDNMTMNTHMSNGMTKKGMLPKTSAAPEGTMSSTNSSNTGILGLIIASFLGILGFRRKNN